MVPRECGSAGIFFLVVTEAVNQTDRREQENVVYFRWRVMAAGFCPGIAICSTKTSTAGVRRVWQTAVNLQQYEQIARGLIPSGRF